MHIICGPREVQALVSKLICYVFPVPRLRVPFNGTPCIITQVPMYCNFICELYLATWIYPTSYWRVLHHQMHLRVVALVLESMPL